MSFRLPLLILIVLTLFVSACENSDKKTPELVITRPSDGQAITGGDDINPSLPGVQIDVSGTSEVIGYGEYVQLWVDDNAVASTLPQLNGPVLFKGITLVDGSHSLQLKARKGKVVSTVHTVTVNSQVKPTAPAVTIVSPAAGATLGPDTTDCNPGRAGLQVAVNVTTDASDGSTAVATFGTAEKSPSVTVSGGTVTLCATVAQGLNIPLEVKVTDPARGVGAASHLINVVLSSPNAPTVNILSPTEGTTFGSDAADCDAGTAGLQIAINVATDADNGSTAVAKVGSASSSATATVNANAVTLCASVEEGLNIPVEVSVTDSVRGVGTATVLINVVFATANAPSVTITSPAAGATITPSATDCDINRQGLQIAVAVTTDAADGSSAVAKIGSALPSPVGTVSGGKVNLCASVSQGNVPLTVTVIDALRGAGVATINVNVVFPSLNTAVSSIVLDGVENNRTWKVKFKWPLVTDSLGSLVTTYVVRCDDPKGSSLSAPINSEVKWSAADSEVIVDLSGSLGLSSPVTATVDLSDLRMQDIRRCLIRGRDAAGALTPLASSDASIDVSVDFTLTRLTVPTSTLPAGAPTNIRRFGISMAAVGDVDSDGLNDFIVGSDGGGAFLYFGRTTWPETLSTPDVVFTATGSFAGTSDDMPTTCNGALASNAATVTYWGLGWSVTGIGDFNGDGIHDIAIADPAYPNCLLHGMTYIVYGRASRSAWQATPVVDLAPSSCTDPATCCGANVCFMGNPSRAGDTLFSQLFLFGFSVNAAGNFDGAGPVDLAIGATDFLASSASAGYVYVVRGGTNYANGSVITVSPNAGANTAQAFQIRPPAADRTTSAQSGHMVTWAYNDGGFSVLAFGAPSVNGGGVGRMYTVKGQPYTSGMVEIDGTYLSRGRSGEVGSFVANLGNWSGGPKNDLSAFRIVPVANTSTVRVYFGGNSGYGPIPDPIPCPVNAPTTLCAAPCPAGVCLDIIGTSAGDSGQLGITAGNAVHPSLGTVGDLDKDGYADALMAINQFNAELVGGVQLFYGANTYRSKITIESAPLNTAPVPVPAHRYRYTEGTNDTPGKKTACYTGDINRDGFADFAFGAYTNTSTPGTSAVYLYH